MAKALVMATWDDVPHLTAQDKADLLAGYPPYQRDARTKGVPQLGSGAIYPIPETDFVIAPFAIPAFWPRSYGLDVGWNFTAAMFSAHDRETDTVYLYDEVYRQKSEPSPIADAIRARGEWMYGAIDPASRGRGQKDGEQLLQAYNDLGLNLVPALNGVEAGIFEVFLRLTTGRLKVFASCVNFLEEYRLYRRDKHGNVVKVHDHCMDATRYDIVSGVPIARVDPSYLDKLGHRSRHVSESDPYRED